MFTIKNWNEFSKGIALFEQQLEKAVEDFYRGWTVKMFQQVVWNTPQWSGNAASNWRYGVGSADTGYETYLLETQAKMALYDTGNNQGARKRRGDSSAVQQAFITNSGRDTKVSMKAGVLPAIFITNNSKSLTGKSYASYLEENPGNFLRPENEPGHMIQNVAYRFGTLGKVNLQAVQAFSRVAI